MRLVGCGLRAHGQYVEGFKRFTIWIEHMLSGLNDKDVDVQVSKSFNAAERK